MKIRNNLKFMMTNTEKNSLSQSKLNSRRLYIVIGLCLIIALMVIWILANNKKLARLEGSTDDPTNDFNVEVSIPDNNTGDLSAVPKEELDSLFANIKQ